MNTPNDHDNPSNFKEVTLKAVNKLVEMEYKITIFNIGNRMISVFGGVLWSELLYRSVSTGAYGQALVHGAIFGLINRFTWPLTYGSFSIALIQGVVWTRNKLT